jgi:hypothetical protein
MPLTMRVSQILQNTNFHAEIQNVRITDNPGSCKPNLSHHRKIDAGKLVLRLGKPGELVLNSNSAKHVENDSKLVPVSSTKASIDQNSLLIEEWSQWTGPIDNVGISLVVIIR